MPRNTQVEEDLQATLETLKPTKNVKEIELDVLKKQLEQKEQQLQYEQMTERVEKINQEFAPVLTPLKQQQNEIWHKINEIEKERDLAAAGYAAAATTAERRSWALTQEIQKTTSEILAVQVFGKTPQNEEEAQAWFTHFGHKLVEGWPDQKVIGRQPRVNNVIVWGFATGKYSGEKKHYFAWHENKLVGKLQVNTPYHGGDSTEAWGQVLGIATQFEKNYNQGWGVREPLKTWVNHLRQNFDPENYKKPEDE